MKNQKKQILLAAVCLFLVSAAYAGMRYYNAKPVETGQEKIYTITQDGADAVIQFSVTNENGSFTFEKKGEAWQCKDIPDFSTDTAVLEKMIQKAVSAVSADCIEDAENLEQYGLTQPAVTISYQTAEEARTLYIGDYNSAIYKYYLRMEGSNTVYTVDSTFRTVFTKNLDDLRLVAQEETQAE